MIARRAAVGIAVLFCTVVFSLCPAQGEEAAIEGFRLERTGGDVSISFSVRYCFSQKMEEAITAGFPTTFNFFVKFYKRRLIKDKKVAARRFRHTIIYDNLKNTFLIWLEETGQEFEVQDLEEAKRYMQRVKELSVTRGEKLEKGVYELAIKAELDPVRLPLRLESILFFVSLWDFETDWYYHIERVEP